MMKEFSLAGEWVIDTTLKHNINCNLTDMMDKRVIYAFRNNNTFKYIGICDAKGTTLKVRMDRYKYGSGSKTNKRIAKLIYEQLKLNESVLIYAFEPQKDFAINNINIDLVRGLEYPLIDMFLDESVKWNK